MTLKEFLSLIEDEEARIELEIDDGHSDDYMYHYFWLSAFRRYNDTAKYYSHYQINSFSFEPKGEKNDQIRIQIKP